MIDQVQSRQDTEAPRETSKEARDPSGSIAPEGSSPEEGTVDTQVTFADLGIGPDVQRALAEMGFAHPREVQTATLKVMRAGRDMMVQSHTGSGKTGAFGIPFADGMVDPKEKAVQAIVLLPTRELAIQVASVLAKISAYSGLSIVPVYGGAPMGRQIEQLRDGGQIVCGTPGRILDHLRRKTLRLDRIKIAVLDECDEMLSMGFQEDIEAILQLTPTERQTWLFSATLTESIRRLSRRYLKDPEVVVLSANSISVPEIQHTYYSVPGAQREAELLRVLAFEGPERALIFCNTREETRRVAEHLKEHGLNAEGISSDLSQSDRENVMARMRAGEIRFLVATDVAARGIDLEKLPYVFNFTFPESPENYIHRTGRTGRAGRAGKAVSLVGPTEVGSFYYLKLLYKIRPEERVLPSLAELRSRREGENVLRLRKLYPSEVELEWRQLARRIMSDPGGERLIGCLLREALAQNETPDEGEMQIPEREAAPPEPEVAKPRTDPTTDRMTDPTTDTPAQSFREPSDERRGQGHRERDRSAGGRGRGPRDHERGSGDRSYGDRSYNGGQRRGRPERAARAPQAPQGPQSSQTSPPSSSSMTRTAPTARDTREFWEVWSEDVGRVPASSPAARPESAEGSGQPPSVAPEIAPPVSGQTAAPGEMRLYLNLGRKDGATIEEITSLLTGLGVSVTSGAIDLMNTHSYINVGAGEGEKLCAGLVGRERNGRSIICEPARPPRRR